MTDRPIIMSAWSVKAIMREIEAPGTGKTATRRILKNQATWDRVGEAILRRFPDQKSGLPYAVGDRLWVRESWRWNVDYHRTPVYRADFPAEEKSPVPDRFYRWRSSLHLPRWASRLTLTVTAVKVERLQSINEADAKAEGVGPEFECDVATFVRGGTVPPSTHVLGFKHVWESLHGPAAWAANPWVAAVRFRPHLRNIDQMDEEAT